MTLVKGAKDYTKTTPQHTTAHNTTPRICFQRQVPRGLCTYAWTNCFCTERAIRQSTNVPRPTRSGTQGKSESCVQREPTGRVLIVIVIVYRRESRLETEKEREMSRERDVRRDREMREERAV